MSAEPGLRERKKRQTRQVITEAAQRLFVARGFDAVTVADVAREANVSEGTVFNYFRTKEDLFYGQMEAFEAELIEAVRDRAPGESVLSAFRRFNEDRSGRLAAEDVAELVATVAPIIAASPALQARERRSSPSPRIPWPRSSPRRRGPAPTTSSRGSWPTRSWARNGDSASTSTHRSWWDSVVRSSPPAYERRPSARSPGSRVGSATTRSSGADGCPLPADPVRTLARAPRAHGRARGSRGLREGEQLRQRLPVAGGGDDGEATLEVVDRQLRSG